MSKALSELTMIDRLKRGLLRAIDTFNRVDAAALLCAQKNAFGSDVEKGCSGWGAASERAISHRLAVYVESELRLDGVIRDGNSIVVDCEYNRHLNRKKMHHIMRELVSIVEKAKRTAKPDVDDDSFYVFSIAPDIVVHERGTDENNLLVVEMKKSTNLEIPEYDYLKLKCFTEQAGYRYKLGAAVTAEDNVVPGERRLLPRQWFKDGVAEE